MASKTSSSSLALFLTLNILFFALVSACGSTPKCPSPKPKPTPKPKPSPCPSPSPSPSPSPPGGSITPPGGSSSSNATCPTDTLKLGVCADVLSGLLGGLLNVTLGQLPSTPCCTLLQGLVDLDAAVCLCTALKANILGISLNIPISLSLLLDACSKQVPTGYQCA